MISDEDRVMVEYVKISPNREKILKSLRNGSLKPSDISKETGVHINNVSRVLKQLKENGLVTLLNPESNRGRLYKLTDDGQRILNELNK